MWNVWCMEVGNISNRWLYGSYADQDLANEIAMEVRDMDDCWVEVLPSER